MFSTHLNKIYFISRKQDKLALIEQYVRPNGEFDHLILMSFHASVIVIVYSVGFEGTLKNVLNIYNRIRENLNSKCVVCLYGTTCKVSYEKGMKKAKEIIAEYFEVSGYTGEGIEQMFNSLIEIAYKVTIENPNSFVK